MSLDLITRYGPALLEGLLVTVQLVAIAVLCGGLLAIPVMMGRISKSRIIRGLAFGYVYFFRGTPLLAQLFLVYYGAGQFRDALEAVGLWVVFRDPFACAAITFTFNTAAYQAEIFRGALASVPRGQWEAARALAIGRVPMATRVVIPQAAIIALRPLGNEIILMIKGSAVASIITVLDLMGETRLAFSRTFDMTIYLYAAVLYLIVVEILRRLWNRLDHRLTRHLRMRPEAGRTRLGVGAH